MRVVLRDAGTADLRDHRPRGRAQRLPDARDRAPGRPSGLTVGAVQAPDNDVVGASRGLRRVARASRLELLRRTRLPPRRPDREGDQGVGRRARAEWACRRAPRRRAGDRCACPSLPRPGASRARELERTVQPVAALGRLLGVGADRMREIARVLGVRTADGFAPPREGRLRSVPGIGPKTEERLLTGLERPRTAAPRGAAQPRAGTGRRDRERPGRLDGR